MDTYGHLFPSTLTDLAAHLDSFSKAFEIDAEDDQQIA